MAVKKTVRGKSELPAFCIRRTQSPHIAEGFSIYPDKVGAYCASCNVRYLEGIIDVDITGRTASGGKWFFHALSEKQKTKFLQSLLHETGLDVSAGKTVMVNIDDISYSFNFE